jgi:AcrR family transcriptional regulator
VTVTVTAAPVRRGRGRPRAAVDDAVHAATLRLLAEDGYQRLSMGAVAREAGISKPALYRRYPSKADLVTATLAARTATVRPVLPDDTRAALHRLLRGAAAALGTPGTLTILGSLLAQARDDPALVERFRDRFFRPQRAVVHGVLRRGVERGEVDPEADVEVVDAMLFGSLLARASLGEPITDAWLDRVIAAAWRSVAAPATG